MTMFVKRAKSSTPPPPLSILEQSEMVKLEKIAVEQVTSDETDKVNVKFEIPVAR